MMILPDSFFEHSENKDEITLALEEYFNRDVYLGEEEERKEIEYIHKLLENEPRILKIFKEEL